MDNKDLDLKIMCKILYEKMGFNTHYEIRLRNKSYINSLKSHDVSDIDVFGYLFNSDLSLFTIGAECKSGESGALEELYKFLGISNYYKLNKAYLLKTKIHQNAREVALSNNIICFAEAEIRKMLLGFEIDVDKSMKIESAKYYKLMKNLFSYKSINEKLIDYIKLDFWNKENWKNIHNLIHLVNKPVGQESIFKDITITDKFVHYYVLELFSFLLLKNIGEAIILNYSDFESAFINCLYGGAESLHEKRRIHDAVNIVAQEDKEFEPEWQSDLVMICSRIAQSTFSASKIPSLLQDIYGNCFYTDKVKIDNRLLKKYPDLTRKYIQDLMQFLIQKCGVDESIFLEFMNL